MTRNSTRRGAGRRVPLRRETVSEDPISVSVVDAANDPVADARVDALVCGWRAEEAPNPPPGLDEAPTVAYCQWGARGFADGDGVVRLPPLPEWDVTAPTEDRPPAGFVPPGIDPLSDERVATSGTAGSRDRLGNASGTQIVLLARYEGADGEWFGATRLPASRVVEYSELFGDGAGGTVTLDRRRLWGPEPMTVDTPSERASVSGNTAWGNGNARTNGPYQFGALSMWQVVVGDSGFRLVVEARAGFPTPTLSTPDQFEALDDEPFPTVDVFGPEYRSVRGPESVSDRDGLRTGMLSVDVDEYPKTGQTDVLQFKASPFGNGIGTQRVRRYRPRVQPLDDPAGYALSGAVMFELNRLPNAKAGLLPLYPAVRDVFGEWSPGGGSDEEKSSLFSSVDTLLMGEGIRAGEAAFKKASEADFAQSPKPLNKLDDVNFTRGVAAMKTLDAGFTAYQAISAAQKLFTPAKGAPDYDFGGGPPFDPNPKDRLQARWTFPEWTDSRMAVVLEVPFTFASEGEATVRVRGSWGASLTNTTDGRGQVNGRVNGSPVRLTDRRVPKRNSTGRRGDV